MSLRSEFERGYSFGFDPFQTRACDSLLAGRSVLVCAPTGAGKTVVGEFGVWLGLKSGLKTFYTTPIKALSNQKFGDFVARHGARNVGLLTGDNSINGEAPVVVMTTEVLRNMLYEGSSTLEGLGYVVLDEVHYLQDTYRGAVWEEVLIHLPPQIKVVALSATVSNAEEFGEWLRRVRGAVEVVIEDSRPVPLEHHYLVGDELFPTFVGDGPNPQLKKMSLLADRRRKGREHTRARRLVPMRSDVVDLLSDRGLLPAIYFIFSRAGCDLAVKQVLQSHPHLVSNSESQRIREFVKLRAEVLGEEDLDVLGYDTWRDALCRGIASHHAGLIPLFKETVEELFEMGLVKVVFATETLSLGINMPAKTVAIERLVKFTGEKHEMMTPSDYTQLTGRAGRRGIDPVGHAVVLFQRDIPFDRIAALAGARTYELRSSFRPAYNMAVNLVRAHGIEEALRMVGMSFAQFIVERSAMGLRQQVERNEEFLKGYREKVQCDAGNFDDYWDMVRRARSSEREEAEAAGARRKAEGELTLSQLRVGDVIRLSGRRKRMLAVVVDRRRGTPFVLTAADDLKRVAPNEVVGRTIARLELPRKYPWKQTVRKQVLAQLNQVGPKEEAEPAPEPAARPALPEQVVAHPCHACPDRAEHERWAERVDSLTKETSAMVRRLRQRTEGLARTFERVIDVLRGMGYLEGDQVTPKGDMLCRIYNEGDLLVAEALEQGIMDDLSIPDLVSVASTLVYETRGIAVDPGWPTDEVRFAYNRIRKIYRAIVRAEQASGVQLCREPDPGFVDAIWAWASGEPLDDVLAFADMTPGDFVRSTKQVWDLLRQLVEVAPNQGLADRCRKAASEVYRGVVAYSGAI